MIVPIWSSLWNLSAGRESTSVFTFSLRYCKDMQILDALDMSGYANPEWYNELVENFRLYLQEKNSTSSPTFFWRYCKDMQSSCFEYFGHALSHTPKMIVSIFRKLMFISMLIKNFIILFFLRYYILKNSAIWLANSILAHNLRARIFLEIEMSKTILVFISFFTKTYWQNLSKNLKKKLF